MSLWSLIKRSFSTASQPLPPRAFDLATWISTQKATYGFRPGLDAELSSRVDSFSRESGGITGILLDRALQDPPMVPIKFWGADVGWRAPRRKARWRQILGDNGIHTIGTEPGALLRFLFNPTHFVPHPYVPPYWALSKFDNFATYITKDQEAFALCGQWKLENDTTLTRRVRQRLSGLPIEVGAQYRRRDDKREWADVAILLPHSDSSELLKFHVVWRKETALADLIRQEFPDAMREYAPSWLRGQRLDVYVPSLNVAFEYQGLQHFEPVDYFGGKEALRRTRERDRRKALACQQAGVVLIEWRYDEPIARDRLLAMLRSCGLPRA